MLPKLPPIRTDENDTAEMIEQVGASIVKPAVASLTLRGILISAMALIAQILGVDLPVEHLSITVNTLVALVGLIMAAWGRVRAQTFISGLVRPRTTALPTIDIGTLRR